MVDNVPDQKLVFNTGTQTPQLASDADIQANPSMFMDIDKAQVKMLGPNGEHYVVAGSDLSSAIEKGWQLPTSEQILHSQKVQETVAQYESGGGNAFLSRFGNALSGGAGDVIEAHAGRTTNPEKEASDIRAEAKAQLLENHPTQSMLGTAAGFIGNAALTGGLAGEIGKGTEGLVAGAEAGLGRAVATKAVGGAAQGAFYAAPQAITQTIYGDPETAAETMLWGLGTGGIIGGGGELLKRGVVAGTGKLLEAGEKYLNPEKLNAKADEMIARRAGINPVGANKLGSERLSQIAKVIEDENIQPGREGADALREDAGSKLGEHFKKIDGLLDSDKDLEKYKLRPQDVANEIKLNVEKAMGGLHTGLDETALKTLDKTTNVIVEQFGKEPIKFSQAQQIAEKLRRDIPESNFFANADDKVNAEVRRSVYDMFRAKQMEMAENAYKNVEGRGDEFADYLSQKKRYQVASDLIRHGEKQFNNANFGSPVDTKGVMSSHLMGFAGGIAGGFPGYITGKLGHKFLGHYVDNMAESYGARALRGLANSEWLPQIMAKDGVETLSRHLDTVGSFLAPVAYKAAQASDPFKKFLGTEGSNGISKQKQFEKVAQSITAAATDQTQNQSQVAAIKHVFGNDPALSDLLAQKHTQAIQYLYGNLPKNPNPPQPFQNNQWQPTFQQIKEFADRLEVVQNPMSVMNHVALGTLTNAHVEALKTVYPQIYQQMIQRVAMAAHKPDAGNVGSGVRLSVEKLTGVNITNPNNINYQAIYQVSQSPQQSKQGSSHHTKMPAKMPNQYETKVQRLNHK